MGGAQLYFSWGVPFVSTICSLILISKGKRSGAQADTHIQADIEVTVQKSLTIILNTKLIYK